MSLSEEQLALRLTGVTGTDIAAIAGISPYNSLADIVLIKKGLAVVPPNHHMERGQFLEDGLMRWYTHRTGARTRATGTLRHPTDKLVMATPDGIATYPDGERVLEFKSPSRHTEALWGEPGTDDIPDFYRTQVMWEMAVTGTSKADVVALMNGDLHIYTVAFSPRLYARLRDVAHNFWDRYIIGGEEPGPDGSEGYQRYLDVMWPHRNDVIDEDESDELMALVQAYEAKRDAHGEAEKALVLAKQELKRYIGDRSGVKGSFCTATYRHNKDSAKTDWRAVAEAAGATPDLVEKFTASKPGARVLRVYSKETK